MLNESNLAEPEIWTREPPPNYGRKTKKSKSNEKISRNGM